MSEQLFDFGFKQIYDVLVDIKNILEEAFGFTIAPKESTGEGGGKAPKNFFKGMTKQFKQMGKMISGMFKSAIGPVALLSDFLMAFLDPLSLITEPLSLMGTILSTVLYPFLIPLNEKLYEFADMLSAAITSIEPFFPAIEAVVSVLIDLFVNTLVSRFKYMFEQVRAIFEFFSATFGDLVALFKGDINITEYFQRLFDNLNILFGQLIENIMVYFRNIWGNILEALDSGKTQLVEWFQNLPSEMVSGITSAGASVANWWEDLWDGG